MDKEKIMKRIKEMADRANLDMFITCLIDGIDISVDNDLNDCEKALEDSYDITITKIKELYPDVDDNDLLDVLTGFAYSHDECYLKMGILIGARLQRELFKGFENIDKLY